MLFVASSSAKLSLISSCLHLLFYVSSQLHDFWRLDYWEDDLRRRRRFVRNAFGSTHADVSLKALDDYSQYSIQIQKRWAHSTPACNTLSWRLSLTRSNRYRRGRGWYKVKENFPQPVSGHPEPGGGVDARRRRWCCQSAAGERNW